MLIFHKLSSLSALPPKIRSLSSLGRFRQLISVNSLHGSFHGADKVLFGSDFPWNDPWRELTLISCLNLPSEDRDLILGSNAERLLGL